MNEAERFQPGELLAASRLNDVIDFSRGQYAQVPGNDFDVFNGQNANGRAQKRFERIMLVRAREDFEIRITNCVGEDDVPAGRVDMPRIIPQVNAYEVPESLRPDWVYDPVAGLSGGPTKSEGDYFHVVFNEDSGRWEVVGVGGGESTITFQPFELVPGIGSWCVAVRSVVISVACGSGVQVGDIVDVWDRTEGSDHFGVPLELLILMTGYAVKMKVSLAERYALPVDPGPCRYEVLRMNCTETQAVVY